MPPRTWKVYLLRSHRPTIPGRRLSQTYVGMTVQTVYERLHEHNHTKAGARTTRSMRPLSVYAYADGFTRRQAAQVEIAVKKQSVRRGSMTLVQRKLVAFATVLGRDQWLNSSEPAAGVPVTFRVAKEGRSVVDEISLPSHVTVRPLE